MASRTAKIAISFAIVLVTVLVGVPFVMSSTAYAGDDSSTVIIVRPGFDDRFVVRRPFFNPFLFDDDFFFDDEEEFFFDDDDFFFDRDERPFFRRFEREDDERPFFRRFERDRDDD
jgi:hypothetical protein